MCFPQWPIQFCKKQDTFPTHSSVTCSLIGQKCNILVLDSNFPFVKTCHLQFCTNLLALLYLFKQRLHLSPRVQVHRCDWIKTGDSSRRQLNPFHQEEEEERWKTVGFGVAACCLACGKVQVFQEGFPLKVCTMGLGNTCLVGSP